MEPLTGWGPTILIPIVIVAALFYFIPSIIAGARGHHQTVAIVVLNLFLGWTFLGWVAALVWAFMATPGKDVSAG